MPIYFNSIPFSWTLYGLAFLCAIYAVRTFLAYRKLPQEAADDWDYQVSENMQDLRLTKESYMAAYQRVNAPRGVLYIASVLGLIVVLSPLAFAFINSILYSLWSATGEPIEIKVGVGRVKENVDALTYEPGNMVWGFFTFFGILAIWALISALAARRYYRNAPGRMRDELIYEKSGFQPTVPLTVGANPVHVMAILESENNMFTTRKQFEEIFKDALGLICETDNNYGGTGLECDIYSDNSEMKIYVHDTSKGIDRFNKETHPFFFENDYAREDDKLKTYTIISLLDDAQAAFEKIASTGISMRKITGSKTSRMRSFEHDHLEFFLYNKPH